MAADGCSADLTDLTDGTAADLISHLGFRALFLFLTRAITFVVVDTSDGSTEKTTERGRDEREDKRGEKKPRTTKTWRKGPHVLFDREFWTLFHFLQRKFDPLKRGI